MRRAAQAQFASSASPPERVRGEGELSPSSLPPAERSPVPDPVSQPAAPVRIGAVRVRPVEARDRETARRILRQNHAKGEFADEPFSDAKFDSLADTLLKRPPRRLSLVAEQAGADGWAVAGIAVLAIDDHRYAVDRDTVTHADGPRTVTIASRDADGVVRFPEADEISADGARLKHQNKILQWEELE